MSQCSAPRLELPSVITLAARLRRAASTAALALIGLVVSSGIAAAQPANIFQRACSSFVPTSAPTVFMAVSINGLCTNMSGLIVPGEKPGTASSSGTLALLSGTITWNAFWNGDPFINFLLTTTNILAAPMDYSFIFGTPIIPGLYRFAEGSLGLTLTPGQTPASVVNSALYPAYLSGYGTLGVAMTNLNVDRGTSACAATSTPVLCPYGSASSNFAPTFYDNLEAMVTYRQTGLQSTASFTGRVELFENARTVVPEPSTYALVAFGFGALGFVVRRRGGLRNG